MSESENPTDPRSEEERVRIRFYEPGDEEGILALFNAVFAEDDPGYRPRSMAHWRWQFGSCPAGRQIVVAEEIDTGRIVAQYACVPYHVTYRGRRGIAGQGVDVLVASEYRRGLKRTGLFLRTAERYFATWGIAGANFYGYGFPNQKAFRIGVKRMGYLPVFSPLETSYRNLFQCADDDAVDAADPGGFELRPIEALEGQSAEQVDRLWARIEPEIGLGIVRDARYLRWRYLECPAAPYRVRGLFDAAGELRGVVALRPDWQGPPILALAELLVPAADRGALGALLSLVCREARASGQQRLELWLPPWHPHFEAVRGMGFSQEPCYFHLCLKVYEPGLEEAWAREHWYFSIGDSDIY
ncbi:MAG: GNAT family N-acetyltransferase [Planctomycetes bacterium]|nr:GNAT family N-acetyltransferase [Planctomycetota bacterium]